MLTTDILPTLSTKRLRLRWLTETDADALFEVFSDPEVTRFWSTPAWTDREAGAALIREVHDSFRQHSLYQWGVTLKTSDRVIGTCTLSSLDARNRRAEIGFALGRSHWKRGYVSEAIDELLRFAFEELKLHRMVLPRYDNVESVGDAGR